MGFRDKAQAQAQAQVQVWGKRLHFPRNLYEAKANRNVNGVDWYQIRSLNLRLSLNLVAVF